MQTVSESAGPFNPSLLVLARESRELTQAELARRTKIAQGALSRYETGLQRPSRELIEVLAEVLAYPVSFFHQKDSPYGFPPFHYRERKKLSAKTVGRIVAEMNIRRMHIGRLLPGYASRIRTAVPEIDPHEYHGRARRSLDIEDVARSVRDAWMLRKGPVPNMVELLESQGAVIVPCQFGTDRIEAISQRLDGLPCLMFVNICVPPSRLRYTLAHELAHMVLHTTSLHDDEKMEEEAREFAGAFLLPAPDVHSWLRRLNLRQLAHIKAGWGVPIPAIVDRAHRLGAITAHQKRSFHNEISQLGFARREPNEPPRETARLLRAMVAYHTNKLGYTRGELAQLLQALPQEFEQMYAPDVFGEKSRAVLRVVK